MITKSAIVSATASALELAVIRHPLRSCLVVVDAWPTTTQLRRLACDITLMMAFQRSSNSRSHRGYVGVTERNPAN